MDLLATTQAASALDLLARLGQIFYFIVLPMLLLAGVGYVIQRKLGLDMATLTRLNFYFVVPGIIYSSVVSSRLAAEDVGKVVAFAVCVLLAMGLVTYAAARLRRLPPDVRNCMLMTTMFHNSGNYGLPLQDLAFRPMGMGAVATSYQVFYMIVQNVSNFTLGVLLAAGGRKDRHWKENLLHVARFPPLYVLAAALATVQVRAWLGESAGAAADALLPFWKAVQYVRDAFVAVALCTLGAQLAVITRQGGKYPVAASVLIRLLLGPAVGLALVLLLGLKGFLAQVMLVSTSTPSAVNCLLLCLEFDNHPQYPARAVLYSTLLSPITVTLTIFFAQGGFLPALAVSERPAPAAVAARRGAATQSEPTMKRITTVSIEGPAFHINGRPTYPGRRYRGMKVEGLLMNARLVQGIFDDLNPQTRSNWDYPDGPWDPRRNTREFLAAMPTWRARGLVSFTINLQGGSPRGYSRRQPWHNSAFEAEGLLRPDYMERLEMILDKADELGMAPILGYFYFGQDERLTDEAAVVRAAENATDWLLERSYANVLVEIANEIDVPRYEHDILTPARCTELVRLVQDRSRGKVTSPAGRLLVSVSLGGGAIPPEAVAAAGDFLLLHGNGVGQPDRIRDMVDACRRLPSYRGQPVLFNEDDHFDFDKPDNNMLAAVSRYAGWGYFDYRMAGEGFDEGYQSVPANWTISSERKRGFFDLLARMTGGGADGPFAPRATGRPEREQT